jgi:hypothetical protein
MNGSRIYSGIWPERFYPATVNGRTTSERFFRVSDGDSDGLESCYAGSRGVQGPVFFYS